jgi:hypothetical protein
LREGNRKGYLRREVLGRIFGGKRKEVIGGRRKLQRKELHN